MPSKTEYLIYLSLGIVVIVFLGLLLRLGLLGWIGAGFLLISVNLLFKWSGLLNEPNQHLQK